MKLNYKLSALTIAVALTCLGAQAQAAIVVLQQHNSIEAGFKFDSNDSLASWKRNLSSDHARASLDSIIGTDSLAISGSAYADERTGAQVAGASTTTQLQFTVSATRTYALALTLASSGFDFFNNSPSVHLLRDGIIVLSGSFTGTFVFEVGHTYEIEASSGSFAQGGKTASGCGFSMQ